MSGGTLKTQLAEATARMAEMERQHMEELERIRAAAVEEAAEENRRLHAAAQESNAQILRLQDELSTALQTQREREARLRSTEEEQARTLHPPTAAATPTVPTNRTTDLDYLRTPRGPSSTTEGPPPLRRASTFYEPSPFLPRNDEETPPPRTGHRKPVVRKPDPYDGTKSEWRKFRTSVRLNLIARRDDFRDDVDRVIFIATHLDGQPLGWFDREFFANPQPRWASDVQLFMDALEEEWGDKGRAEEAMVELRYLEQGADTVTEFYDRFQTLCADARVDPETRVDDFRHKLREQLQNDLVTRGPVEPRNLREWYQLAKRFETRRLERQAEKEAKARFRQPPAGRSSSTNAPKAGGGNQDGKSGKTDKDGGGRQAQQGSRGRSGAAPTRNGSTQPTSTGTATPAAKRCYECQQLGHIARECPQRNAKVAAHIEELEESEEDDAVLSKN
ncbi:gag-pol polyprotein [Trichosporon asahii var. asahii CBS 8904]|uniref:Gag-pol polyprotein n=1 Tax=Trichosporon asahii var. asahii (strain CBS 8904) TaxID=1220162 RepID=K1W2Y7_TRIAC|nr:gag-pol polyprotein [Trichosporon asahii var. asahii CBS 8904]